jgi:hypothetical protein
MFARRYFRERDVDFGLGAIMPPRGVVGAFSLVLFGDEVELESVRAPPAEDFTSEIPYWSGDRVFGGLPWSLVSFGSPPPPLLPFSC